MSQTTDAPYYLLLTFWGERFRGYTCRYALPSLLAPGNLAALRGRRAKFLIATTPDDWAALEREPVFAAVRAQIEVEFIDRGSSPSDIHKYVFMSQGHALLAERCFRDRAFAININPDSIYPDGSIAEAVRLADSGQDVVLCAAVRFEMEGVDAALAARGARAPDAPLVLPVREAVAIGLRNLHPETRASDWDANNFGRLSAEHKRAHFLTCCLWRVPGEDGALIVTHNWSPFVVNYGTLVSHDTSALDGRALDGNYIFENFPEHTQAIHVVRDSDSLFLLGLTPRDEMVPPDDSRWWKNVEPLREWVRGYIFNRTVFDPGVDEYREQIYRLPVRWHARDIDDRWAETEALAERIIAAYASEDLDEPGRARDSDIRRRIALAWLRPQIVDGSTWTWKAARPVLRLARRAARIAQHLTFGNPPRYTPLHREQLDAAAVLAHIDPVLARRHCRMAWVNTQDSPFARLFDARTDPRALARSEVAIRSRSLDVCLIETTADAVGEVPALYERVAPLMRSGGVVLVAIANAGLEDFSDERLAALIAQLPVGDERELTFVGGAEHLAVNRRFRDATRHSNPLVAKAMKALLMVALVPAVWRGNRIGARAIQDEARRHWTTLLVSYRVRRTLAKRAPNNVTMSDTDARPTSLMSEGR